MVQDYNGATVIDGAGDKVGTVERSYDDATGAVKYVQVKIGALLGKHRLVPVDAAQLADDGLHVPFSRQQIEDSPKSSAEDTLEGDLLGQVRSYYGGLTSDADMGGSDIVAVPAGKRAADSDE